MKSSSFFFATCCSLLIACEETKKEIEFEPVTNHKCYWQKIYTNLFPHSCLTTLNENNYTIFDVVHGDNTVITTTYVTGSSCDSKDYTYSFRMEFTNKNKPQLNKEYNLNELPFAWRIDASGMHGYQEKVEPIGGKLKFTVLDSAKVEYELLENIIIHFTDKEYKKDKPFKGEIQFLKGKYTFIPSDMARELLNFKRN